MQLTRVAHWEESKYIVVSSALFMVPAIYCLLYEFYKLGILLTLTSGFSINFWMNAVFSWRRTLDHICAKVAYCVFVWNGILYIRTVPDIILSMIVMIAMVYCYYLSHIMCGVVDGWVKYHVAFHLLAIQGQIIIINRMNDR